MKSKKYEQNISTESTSCESNAIDVKKEKQLNYGVPNEWWTIGSFLCFVFGIIAYFTNIKKNYSVAMACKQGLMTLLIVVTTLVSLASLSGIVALLVLTL